MAYKKIIKRVLFLVAVFVAGYQAAKIYIEFGILAVLINIVVLLYWIYKDEEERK